MNSATDIPVQVKAPRRRIRWLKLGAIGIIVASCLVAGGFLYFFKLINGGAYPDVRKADAIVVLTGGADRIPAAVKLLKRGKGQRLLISGVNPITTRNELASLAPNSKRLFSCCIDVDHVARDTIGNADETRHWVKERGFDSIIVVTASYHMPRSLAELRRALPDTTLIPYPVKPGNMSFEGWWSKSGMVKLLAIEYAKFVPAFARCLVIQISLNRGVYGGGRQCLNVNNAD